MSIIIRGLILWFYHNDAEQRPSESSEQVRVF